MLLADKKKKELEEEKKKKEERERKKRKKEKKNQTAKGKGKNVKGKNVKKKNLKGKNVKGKNKQMNSVQVRSVQNQTIQSEHQVPVELQSLVDHDAKEKIINSESDEDMVFSRGASGPSGASSTGQPRSKMSSSHLEHQVPVELLQVLVGPGVSVNFHLGLGMIVQRRMMVLSV